MLAGGAGRADCRTEPSQYSEPKDRVSIFDVTRSPAALDALDTANLIQFEDLVEKGRGTTRADIELLRRA